MRTLLLALLLPTAALAQGTGTIAGTVIDSTSGEVLIGANVVIEGTGLGAATDIGGNYRIIGVPVGVYIVSTGYPGFQHSLVENVRVLGGLTTDLTFVLGTDPDVEWVEVCFHCGWRYWEELDPFPTRRMSAEELERLPLNR